MTGDVDPYELYRKDLDGKIISTKEAGGDYEFQFSRPVNRQSEIQIIRLSTGEKFKSSIVLKISNNECMVKMDLSELPDDLKLELEDLKEKEYNNFIDSLRYY